jgi:acyl-homoserine-lactone acylase
MLIAFSRIFLYNWSVDDGFSELISAGVRPGFERTSRGSNQFAISPSRSAEGAAILYIDPHLAWFGPSRFWEFRVHAGNWHGSGFTLAGLPYIGLGHNAKVAWAMTTGGPDTADIYELTLNPDNPNQYRYEGQWRDMVQRVEVIEIRDKQPEEVTVFASHHGPIVAWKGDKAYAHRMAYHECVNGLEAWYHFNFAEDFRDVQRGLEGNEVFPQNVMVADSSGNIYYHRTGRVPKRPDGYDWTRPVPGDTSSTEWTGLHSQSDLVHLLNPPAGYMQNCNITPDAMLVDSPLQPDRYPTYIYGSTGKQMNERGARAVELLSINDRVTAQQAIDMALDVVPFGYHRWLSELKKADASHGNTFADHPLYRKAVQQLLAWDGRVDRQSQGGLLYYYWRAQIDSDKQVGKKLPGLIDQHFRIAQSSQPFSAPQLNVTHQQLLVTSLAAASDRVVEEWQSLDATWGDKFRVGRDGRSWPLGGGGDYGTRTLRNISYGPEREDHTRWGNAGQTSTQIVVLSQPIRSWTQPPIGQSDHPDSPHYADQAARLLSERRMKETWWMPEDLAGNILSRQVLADAPK